MKTRTILLIPGLACLLILASAQTSTPVLPVSPQSLTFALVGLAPDQTARLNALGLPMGGPIIAGSSCQVILTFLDDQGNSLKTVTQTLTAGKSTPFDLQFNEISNPATSRAEIRGTVRTSFTITNPGGPTPPVTPMPVLVGSCSVLPSLEIFDQATGKTTVMLNSTQALPTILPL